MDQSHINVPVATSQFIELADFLKEHGSDRDPVEVISNAIVYWMDNASWKQADLMPETLVEDLGYRWKNLFLPHGTRIRMRYKGEYYYAEVRGDKFMYNGETASPSIFANRVTRSSRNAWRDLEIRRPGDDEWYVADSMR